MPVPAEPVCFNKFPNVICGNGDPIDSCAVETSEMDFEVELCMVRAQPQLPAATLPSHAGPLLVARWWAPPCRVTSPRPRRTSTSWATPSPTVSTTLPASSELRSHTNGAVFCADVSARDWQLKKNGGQWLLGKTFDNYAPIGPAIVTKSSIDPNNVAIMCRVNGETLQDGHTREFVFNPQFCLVSPHGRATHDHLPPLGCAAQSSELRAQCLRTAIRRFAGCAADKHSGSICFARP